MAFLAVSALASVWLVVLYVLALAVAYDGIQLVHRFTFLYGPDVG